MIHALDNIAHRSYRSILTDLELYRLAMRRAKTELDRRWFAMNAKLLERCLKR